MILVGFWRHVTLNLCKEGMRAGWRRYRKDPHMKWFRDTDRAKTVSSGPQAEIACASSPSKDTLRQTGGRCELALATRHLQSSSSSCIQMGVSKNTAFFMYFRPQGIMLLIYTHLLQDTCIL